MKDLRAAAPAVQRIDNLAFLQGGGEMGARMREMDWSATSLGPVETWPQSIRSTLSMLLPSKAQIILFWGPEFTVFYNDAYRPVFGAKHPGALGLPGREAWSEIWDNLLFDLLAGVVRTGEAFWAKDLLFELERYGFLEETYFDVSYDPVRVESGAVGGVYCIVTETTERVVGARRLSVLKDLAERNAAARTAREACVLAIETLAAKPDDVAFALAYLGGDLQSATPQAEARLAGSKSDLVVEFSIMPSNASAPAGRLVVGLNPRRPYDARYRAFLELVADQLGTALVNARAYEEERKRTEALAELDRAKTTFFSNISHEFRTPLTLMLGPTEDALNSPERALTGEDLEVVHRNELRLLKLVNTLLDFSRMEAGRAAASYIATDLAQFTADVASTFRSAFGRAGLEFVVDCPPLSQPVFVDREMWEKIVLNLLSNALKFTLDGSVSVSLREHDGGVTLQVRDTGVGIAAGEIPRLFERFHRVQDGRGRTHEGSGIGLALVSELVKMHGGTLDVTSELNAGTTFAVSIPTGVTHLSSERVREAGTGVPGGASAQYLAETHRWVPDAERAASSSSPGAALSPTETTPRIVVADDNADMREYVQRLLSDRWIVDAYADGASALDAVRRHPPALVIADVMMPGLDGFELLRRLQTDSTTATVPVILLSARAGEEAQIGGLEAGASDYLVKPFSARELRARVDAQILQGQLRAAQEIQARRLADIFRQAPVAVAILRGPDHVFDFANEMYLSVIGHRPILGRPILEALPELADQGVRDVLDRVRHSGGAFTANSFRLRLNRGADGAAEEAFFTFVYQPIRDDEDRVDGIAAILVDVTELVHARREAESANRAKDEFIAMLGHELRNPLAPILTALQLMRLRGFDAAERERTIIERQMGHLVGLVDDLLDVSRITKGKLELRKEDIELAEVVADAVETASPLLEARQQVLNIQVPRQGCMIHADRKRMSQVLANLLTNAAKYTEHRGSVEVTASREADSVVIAVRDNGVGIEPDMQAKVFEMFTQAHQTLDRSEGGLGLGLTIVRSLVDLHGGTITLFSAGRGCGTTFSVRLPCVSTLNREVDATVPSAHAPPRGASRVLIVDDNSDSAEMLQHALSALGYATEVTLDAASALQAIEARVPDVALLDIGLPVMSGYELAQRLREVPASSEIALIALTGYGQQMDRDASALAGFDAHLVKPVDLHHLAEVIGTLTRERLERSRAQ
jgi:signal transduction histidine kinase